jgi:hypothetical protein
VKLKRHTKYKTNIKLRFYIPVDVGRTRTPLNSGDENTLEEVFENSDFANLINLLLQWCSGRFRKPTGLRNFIFHEMLILWDSNIHSFFTAFSHSNL